MKWPPDCRTEGFKTAKHYKNRGLGTTTWPITKNGRFLALKNGQKTREQSISSKIEACFKQKLPKNGLLSAGFLRRKPSRCRTEGVQGPQWPCGRPCWSRRPPWPRLGRPDRPGKQARPRPGASLPAGLASCPSQKSWIRAPPKSGLPTNSFKPPCLSVFHSSCGGTLL